MMVDTDGVPTIQWLILGGFLGEGACPLRQKRVQNHTYVDITCKHTMVDVDGVPTIQWLILGGVSRLRSLPP